MVTAYGGDVQIVFPPDAVTEVMDVAVDRITAPPEDEPVVPQTLYRLRPEGLHTMKPVELSIRFDPGLIPPGIDESTLTLEALGDEDSQAVESVSVDAQSGYASGLITVFGTYGVTGDTLTNSPPSELVVSTLTIGEDPDPDGYTVMVDDEIGQSLGVNDSVTFSGLTAEDHQVRLTDVAPNCTVDGQNPVMVVVATGTVVRVGFTVICTSDVGNLDVTAATSGQNLDPDGYTAVLDGTTSRHLSANESDSFNGVAAGPHKVELKGVASNCKVSGGSARSVVVSANQTAKATFEVSCSAETGSLRIRTSTTGSAIDSNGFTVTIDGGNSRSIGVNGSVTYDGLAAGDHQVRLGGVASNCTVSGQNPRTATVTAGQTDETTFNITCAAETGSIAVNTSTTGDAIDSNGYTVTVDGGNTQSIGVNASISYGGLTPGDHQVQLGGVASNCTVSGQNPRTVTVTANQSVATTFSIACAGTSGSLKVSTSTGGSSLDSNGYTVTVDGGNSRSVGVNGSVTYDGLAPGDHQVRLGGVASNCSVSGGNPRTVSVTASQTIETTFEVTCATETGSLKVTSSTTGASIDSNGYTVTLDGGDSRSVGVNGSVTYDGLAPGDHQVRLGGVASNCTVSGPNPRTVTVTANQTVATTFEVSCAAQTGGLKVITSTTGSSLDSNGYTVTIDGGNSRSVGINTSTTYSDLAAGDRQVQLGGVASNCTVSGQNPRTVTVTAGQTVETTFEVSCSAGTGGLKVTSSTTGSSLDSNGYTVTVDGGNSRSLGINTSITYSDLTAGDRQVQLGGIASNCAVSGANPRTVTVTANQTAQTTFEVTCSSQGTSISVAVWRRGVVSLKNTSYSGNPFELVVDGTFTHTASGTTLKLPAYYAGNDTWKLGFMPTRSGEWTYVTSSADPDLNGVTGTVNATSSSNRGLLKADPQNARKWRFADGSYMPVPIALRMDFFYESASQSAFEAAADFMAANNILMLDTRLQNESSSTMLVFDGAPSNHRFNLPLWDQMERRMEALAARGLGAYIMPYTDDAGRPQWSGGSATEALLLRYMVARLAGYPIVLWDTGIDIAEYRSQGDVDWFGQRVRALDPYNHPISSRHGGGSGGIVMSGQTYNSRGDRHALVNDMIDYFNASRIPTGMFDAWGENRPSHPDKNFTPADIRRAAWKTAIAGGLAFIIRGSDGFFHINSVASDLESEQWLRLVNPFLRSKFGSTFGSMVPSAGLVGNGYALANSSRSHILYFLIGANDRYDSGNGGAITVKLSGLSGTYTARWFDPRTGSESSAGTLSGGSDHTLTPPSSNDWVLWLRKN